MDTHTELRKLNALRDQSNMKPLKAWKGSKQALRDQIEKLTTNIRVTVCPEPAAMVERRKRDAKIDKIVEKRLNGIDVVDVPPPEATAKPFEAPLRKHKLAAEGTFTLAEIARSLNIDPKVARARLRRSPVATSLGKYVYNAEGKAAVLKVLGK